MKLYKNKKTGDIHKGLKYRYQMDWNCEQLFETKLWKFLLGEKAVSQFYFDVGKFGQMLHCYRSYKSFDLRPDEDYLILIKKEGVKAISGDSDKYEEMHVEEVEHLMDTLVPSLSKMSDESYTYDITKPNGFEGYCGPNDTIYILSKWIKTSDPFSDGVEVKRFEGIYQAVVGVEKFRREIAKSTFEQYSDNKATMKKNKKLLNENIKSSEHLFV